ncbi:AAA family ATPase [Frigoribacterium sp. RIT-PI-h]|uniref:AAA family ATPase n=1 Tax=Frigoribacterium sp. RIT-PI-h TaxID=1690245 RepID=UPI00137935EB|nr:AAA family ATPase [Frigoribacterium sp. RIT-PI-h]
MARSSLGGKMRIALLEIQNFRKLHAVRIEVEEATTLFVGANNSGKTSAMDAIQLFLAESRSFVVTDFTLSNLELVDRVGKFWEDEAGLGATADDTMVMPTKDKSTPGVKTAGETETGQPPVEMEADAGETDETATEPDSPPITDSHSATKELMSVLPTLDIWIMAKEQELYRVETLLPLLESYQGVVGVRLRWAPRDIEMLRSAYLERRQFVVTTLGAATNDDTTARLWPSTLSDFLTRQMSTYFHVEAFKLDPDKLHPALSVGETCVGVKDVSEPAGPQALRQGANPLEGNPLGKLIQVDIVNAQRHLGGDDRSGRLSRQVATYYERHLDFDRKPEPKDLEAIRATQEASRLFDQRLSSVFKGPLKEIAKMGYPGGSDPEVVIRTSLQLVDGLSHRSVLRYQVGKPAGGGDASLELPEGMNGLGYQNLVLMIFNLMLFRDGRHRVGKAAGGVTRPDVNPEVPPIHLVLVEEPEAHLHAQVQQVFINHAYATLCGDSERLRQDLGTQLIVSTHSSHIAHEVDFSSIRYFRREEKVRGLVPLTTVRSLAEVFGNKTESSQFVQRYIKVQHCNVLFADALVLLEGAAERILLPHFVANEFPTLNQGYIEYLDIGGAHAHRLRPLVETLGIPTLIITDLDAGAGTPLKKVLPKMGSGQRTMNTSLRDWLEVEDIDALVGLHGAEKTKAAVQGGLVHFAFQGDMEVSRDGIALGVALPSTFEDSLALFNYDVVERAVGTSLTGAIVKALELGKQGDLNAVVSALFESLAHGEKARFAIDILTIPRASGQVRAPLYIADGLLWLQHQVERLPLVTGLAKLASDTDGSADVSANEV